MSTSTAHRFGSRSVVRIAVAALSAVAIVAGLPALLLLAALRRFDHASPLHGVKVPWQWTFDDLRSWGRHLTDGLDSSGSLVDLFFRVALVVGWTCVGLLVYTVIDEVVFQVRHGMPSSRHRRLGALGSLGRRLATVLVAVLPLAASATPTLAGPAVARPAVAVVIERAPDLAVAGTAVPSLPRVEASTAEPPSAQGGRSSK